MKNFYKIDVINISQTESGSGGVFTGKMTFEQLLTIHRLTERKESTLDPFGKKKIDYQKQEEEEFQRHLSTKKLNEIKTYLNAQINSDGATVFPSAVILSFDLNENNSDNLDDGFIQEQYLPDLESCFVTDSKTDKNFKTLYVPKNPRICLIVDGQHRFYGLKKFYDGLNDNPKAQEKVKKFEFITTILLGFDAYQVGQVFANVNFHQKPVNRSLYYDIFGASSSDNNPIQLSHYLALHLQNNSDSPLHGMIKLLGKGYGLFSQAFFVEKILIHFNNGVWNDLYENFKSNGKDFLKIPDFIKAYFNSIEFHYSSCWPKKVERGGELVYSAFAYDYILCKTTGMGAFLRLIKDIYPIVEDLNSNERRLKLEDIFSKITQQQAEKYFSKHGEFGGAGSEGLQLKLYKKLKYLYNLKD